MALRKDFHNNIAPLTLPESTEPAALSDKKSSPKRVQRNV
jgi:hypothetical protein